MDSGWLDRRGRSDFLLNEVVQVATDRLGVAWAAFLLPSHPTHDLATRGTVKLRGEHCDRESGWR